MAFFDWIFFFFAPVIRVFHVFGLEIWHIKTEALKAEPLYRVFVLWLGMVDARSAMSQNFRVAWLLHFTNVKIWMKRFLCEPLPVMCKTFHKSSSFFNNHAHACQIVTIKLNFKKNNSLTISLTSCCQKYMIRFACSCPQYIFQCIFLYSYIDLPYKCLFCNLKIWRRKKITVLSERNAVSSTMQILIKFEKNMKEIELTKDEIVVW